MNIINLFKNKLDRILSKKSIIIVAVVVIPIMIGIAVIFSTKASSKETIAFLSNNVQNTPVDSRYDVQVVHKKPTTADLVLGKYVAIVEEKNSGNYEVTTLKSEEDKKIIENFFKSGKIAKDYKGEDEIRAERGVGTNILGFILMLLLMQGVALTTLFEEDRNIKTFRRILTSPVSEKKYLFSQGMFTFLCLFIPSYLAVTIISVCFRINIGYSFGMLAILMIILSALSTAFALFMTAVLDRDISLVTSGISLITCVLAGCFISFTNNNKVLDTLCNIFPQKSYMTLIHGIEKGNGILEFKGQLIYLLIWIIALWILGSIITKSKMKKGIY
ncbi:ABC transporter permease [Clostridium estertheticum]|uniref:ABC transporter permease n=1 Tax=Clostridium estertheticum TaxID=238834 RepID=A0A5N7J3H3_9CLOT|nr:ABC transporter permease [Clostridium estertheticum]MPQ32631.1 ABC transporter permease [Clostridium estertheticum]MPQ63290.1 ABC transporter permease [Clostridium estertheticum]